MLLPREARPPVLPGRQQGSEPSAQSQATPSLTTLQRPMRVPRLCTTPAPLVAARFDMHLARLSAAARSCTGSALARPCAVPSNIAARLTCFSVDSRAHRQYSRQLYSLFTQCYVTLLRLALSLIASRSRTPSGWALALQRRAPSSSAPRPSVRPRTPYRSATWSPKTGAINRPTPWSAYAGPSTGSAAGNSSPVSPLSRAFPANRDQTHGHRDNMSQRHAAVRGVPCGAAAIRRKSCDSGRKTLGVVAGCAIHASSNGFGFAAVSGM